jgi:hypothetical protein
MQPQHQTLRQQMLRQQMLRQQMLAPSDFLEASLAHLQGEIEGMLQPFEEALTLAQTLLGPDTAGSGPSRRSGSHCRDRRR